MTRPYTVPGDVFSELATGAGGRRAMQFLAKAERSKHLLLVRNVVVTAERMGHERAWELAEAYDLLANLQKDAPEAVEAVLTYPSVGTWAIRMLLRVLPSKTGGPLSFAYLPGLALAAAIRAGATTTLEVTVPNGRLVLPSLGVARVYGVPRRTTTRVTVSTHADGAQLWSGGMSASVPGNPEHYAEGWMGLRRLSTTHRNETFHVLLDDIDPFRLPEGWPAARQRPGTVQQWQQALTEAWVLLKNHHPWYAEEVLGGVTTFVPLSRPAGRPTSATSRYAFGAFAGSLPPNGRMLASLLSHEVQHSKLWALLDLIPLTAAHDHADRPLWYAPWREDPRPLMALLQGAYAHLAVAAFWRVQRFLDQGEEALHAHAEYARWRQHTIDVIETLRVCGMLTPAGDAFVSGMATAIDGWRDDDVPFAAARRAHEAALEHQKRWAERNI
ncbi:hypothetical protein GCM10009555_022850 [Acrocarpospora macrocephala]|uniref:HEXXH motif domain-containing protein n=1 Tax=Acrocarpospora macrocephala TaxID=150177 RepID=A0A5M3WS60_9ACTN|nr:HEXXH motif domain-containing protein [Acrocarpospora macrocephala]GES12217.1 HEXXH motif domain-containing protein [Acrocarpospora macrocephala]